MTSSAKVINSYQLHDAVVATNNNSQEVHIPAKSTGYGSVANGGELLFLALATCY